MLIKTISYGSWLDLGELFGKICFEPKSGRRVEYQLAKPGSSVRDVVQAKSSIAIPDFGSIQVHPGGARIKLAINTSHRLPRHEQNQPSC